MRTLWGGRECPFGRDPGLVRGGSADGPSGSSVLVPFSSRCGSGAGLPWFLVVGATSDG